MRQFREDDFTSEKFQLSVWKKIFKIVLEDKKYFVLVICSIIGVTLFDIFYPLLNAYALKTFFESQDFTNVKPFLIIYASSAIIFSLLVFSFIRFAGILETNIGYKIRKSAFTRLQELSFSYYDKTPAGWIMARLTADSRRLAVIISWGLVDMLWGFVLMLGILITLFIINFKLALILLFLLPVLFVVSLYFRKKILAAFRNVRRINSEITAAYNEGILGAKTTKTLVLEEKNFAEFERITDRMRVNSIKATIRSALIFPVMLVISYVGVLLILSRGGKLVFSNVIEVSVLYLFITYTIQFFDPIMQIARILAELQQAQAAAERIISLIENTPDIEDTPEVIAKYGDSFNQKRENWEPLIGNIEFKNVEFQYVENEEVLKDFNLIVPAGTSVALVGETGSGKSTIVNLICRFYEPTRGQILIDGSDYRNRSQAWLRANLGYVLQSPHLFNGTIFENIAYGKENATLEEVIAASKVVNAHDFIIDMDDGYETNVGEGGEKLSQGQRQLISFARAIIADPKILILDEATSSIDTETELLVQTATNELMTGRTSFVIAHRLSTIKDADIIVVIKDGKILEYGSHTELLNQRGEYFELYKTQFIDEQIKKTKN